MFKTYEIKTNGEAISSDSVGVCDGDSDVNAGSKLRTNKSSGLSGGAIAGIIIACVVALLAGILAAVLCKKNSAAPMLNNTTEQNIEIDTKPTYY